MTQEISLLKLTPSVFTELVQSSGAAFISQVGEESVRNVVVDVLCGVNLRASTERITRQRIWKLNAATLLLYLRGLQAARDFSRKIPRLAASVLNTRGSKSEKWLAQWMLGLTNKGVQNVLRDDSKVISEFAETFAESLESLASESMKDYGDLDCCIKLGSCEKVRFDWHDILSLFCTIGSQTLAIRGSEKSTYGKLFERLILGSVLSILDFELTDYPPRKLEGVFWLSSKIGEREADATVLIRPGQAIRFDLGFIGRGNPEITKDKVSRFERELELGRRTYSSSTIIIVDRLGGRSGLQEQAKRAGAFVIQMSMSHWPKQLAQILEERFSYRHELTRMAPAFAAEYFQKKLRTVHFGNFIRGLKVAEHDEAY
jgi:hypothetical protein